MLTKALRPKGSIDRSAIHALDRYTAGPLPADYVEFILETGGAEGWVGDGYISFWRPDELMALNESLDAPSMPGVFFFGTDGGGMAYGFDTRSTTRHYVEIGDELLSRDRLINRGDTLVQFLEHIAKGPAKT